MSKEKSATVPQPKTALPSQPNLTADDLARRFAALDSEAEEVTPEATEVVEEVTEVDADDATEVVEEESTETEIESETTAEEEADEAETKAEGEVDEDAVKLEYPKFKARVDKLTAQKKELETQLAAAQAKAAEQQQPEVVAVAPTESNPFSNLLTLESVTQEAQQAESVIKWATENSEGVVVKGKDGKETEYTSEQVAKIRYNAEKAIRSDLPKQWRYVQESQHFNTVAEAEYPWFKDKTSKDYVEAQAALKSFPELLRFAEHKVTARETL
jgi:hypothetical protein